MTSVDEPERLGFVYALVCPVTREIRYVGQTRQTIANRMKTHRLQAKREDRQHLHIVRWLNTLSDQPVVEVLARLPLSQLNEAEMLWISYLRELGCDLTNMTDGGTGGPTRIGYVNPQTQRDATKRTWTGRKHTPEARTRISAGAKRRAQTDEGKAHLKRISPLGTAAHYGQVRSDTP